MNETKVSWVQAITNHQSTARRFINSNLGADPERLPAWPRPALLSHRWPLATDQWQIAQHTEPGCQAPASARPLSGESPYPKDAALHAIKVPHFMQSKCTKRALPPANRSDVSWGQPQPHGRGVSQDEQRATWRLPMARLFDLVGEATSFLPAEGHHARPSRSDMRDIKLNRLSIVECHKVL